MSIKLIRIDLSEAPRLFKFPLPVMDIGTVTEDHSRFCGNHDRQIEFCVRMNSEDEFAVDTVGETVYTNRFPHVFVKIDGRMHEYHYSGEREAFFFIYHSSLLPRFADLGIDMSRICWEIELSPRVMELIRELISLFPVSQERGVADRVDSLCWILLQELVLMQKENRGHKDPYEGKIRRIASYIQLHYHEQPEIGPLIQENGLSRRSFFRYWKRFYTKSPAQMILELKMKEARRLLAFDSMQIAEIAEQLKFADSAYFIYTFRKYFGMTPLQYRRKLK